MDDRELDRALRAVVTRRHAPPERVVRLAKAKVRGRHLIQVVSLLSLLAQILFFGFVVFALAAPEVEPEARIAGLVALFAYLGCIVVVLVAARDHVRRFFRRVEYLTT